MKYTYLAFFQRCFSPRGWDRGQVVFVDLLALQYPDQNHCDVFVKRKNSTTPEQLPGEKCSILEEVSLLTNMRVCNNKVQVLPNVFYQIHTTLNFHSIIKVPKCTKDVARLIFYLMGV